MKPLCALCIARPAEVYCKNDDANLCAACDVQCHSSNPLAARHERVPLCGAPHHEPASSAAGPELSFLADSDLAVVPELAAPGGACELPLQFGDGVLSGGAGGAAAGFCADDLLMGLGDSGCGSLLDFDLQDLFAADSPRGHAPAPLLLDGLVPAAPAAPDSLLSSEVCARLCAWAGGELCWRCTAAGRASILP